MNSSRKRFWTNVSVTVLPGGYGVALDEKPVLTPARAPLVMPSKALAQAVAGEWRDTNGEITPATMPLTRLANSAIDKVGLNRTEITGMLCDYGGTDLLCYRATDPSRLVDRQSRAWDPLLGWLHGRFGARLSVNSGVMFKPQQPADLDVLRDHLNSIDDFPLMGLHELVLLSGSLVIGLAVQEGYLPCNEGWALSRIDEIWQAEQWGEDEDAMREADAKQQDFSISGRFLDLLKQ